MDWSLLAGPFPIVLLAGAIGAVVFLVVRRRPRRWWTVIVPTAVVSGVVGAFAANWYVTAVWRPFPDALPTVVVMWIGVGIASLVLLVANSVIGGWWRRGLAIVAIVVVIVGGVNEINRIYGAAPTISALVGNVPAHTIPLPEPTTDIAAPSAAHSARPRHPAADAASVPHAGQGAVSTATIPGAVSGFAARPAWIYFPPAYLARPRPLLPVLVLIPGQPGTPRDWIQAGHVVTTMNDFADAHGGLAPVVVMPDVTGSVLANTLCVDSPRGNAESYVTRDVVRWVRTKLQVDDNTAHWAIGGFSFGGTCALQFTLRHPEIFPTFLDVAGQLGPTLGSVARTVKAGFGGDTAAYDDAQPLRMIARAGHDPAWAAALRSVRGIFVAGAKDRRHTEIQHTLADALTRAGAQITEWTVPGGHSWYVPASALKGALPDLAPRLGLP